MRFALVESEKANYPVRTLCRVLEVSSAGFYAWRRRRPCRRERENAQLLVAIEAIHQDSRRTYGSPRVHAELLERGHQVGLNVSGASGPCCDQQLDAVAIRAPAASRSVP